jgi:hypothetical protein
MNALVLAEFDTPTALLEAARTLREEGRARLDAFTPYPIHGLEEALRLKRSPVPVLAALGALSGVTLAYGTQWYLNAVNYPIVVGGKPPHAPPMFIPVTFELGILLTAFAIFFGMMFLMRLPQPYHPVFELDAFKSASTHAFWLSAEVLAADAETFQTKLRSLGARQVSTVERAL